MEKSTKLVAQSSNGLNRLPIVLWMHFLSLLPAKSLIIVRTVSKFFKTITNDPYFNSLHLNNLPENRHESLTLTLHPIIHPNIPPNRTQCTILKPENSVLSSWEESDHSIFTLVSNYGAGKWYGPNPDSSVGVHAWSVSGSANGLLLMIAGDLAILFNPSIRKTRKLHSPSSSVSLFKHMNLGLTYDSSCNDYKALAIIDPSLTTPGTVYPEKVLEAASGAWVYSVRTDSWKAVGMPSCRHKREKSESLWFDGALVWIEGVDTGRSYYHHMVRFEFGTETFRYAEMPYPIKNNLWVQSRLVVIDGGCSVGVWGLDSDNIVGLWAVDGSGESWSRVYDIGEGVFRMNAFRGREMMWEYWTKGARPKASLYDETKGLHHRPAMEYAGVYFESLVLLK